MNIQKNTKEAAAALKTQIVRQIEKKTYTHDTDSWRQANTQGICVREAEAIIGKALRLGMHTPYHHLGVNHVNADNVVHPLEVQMDSIFGVGYFCAP